MNNNLYVVELPNSLGQADVTIKVQMSKSWRIRIFLGTKVVIPLLCHTMRLLLWMVGFKVGIEIDWKLQ